jgi:hypothetical protein
VASVLRTSNSLRVSAMADPLDKDKVHVKDVANHN